MSDILIRMKFVIRDIKNILKRGVPNVITILRCHNKGQNIAFLLDTPTYLNLGDQAISYAEKVFIQENFPDLEILEIEGYMVKYYIGIIKFLIKNGDRVFHVGGGNFGDLYSDIENNRLNIIRKLKNHKIILFPQTIYYSDSIDGKNHLKMMKEAINNHNNVVIAAREKESYQFAIRHFNADVVLCPDIVLYLNARYDCKRDHVLLCFRDDKEQNKEYYEDIKIKLEKLGISFIKTDTIASSSFLLADRERVLKRKLREFQSASVVITDRLHGMIFSVITGTPCLVFPNNNFKVKSFYYTWLADIHYIRYSESLDNVEAVIQDLMMKVNETNNYVSFDSLYNDFLEMIN